MMVDAASVTRSGNGAHGQQAKHKSGDRKDTKQLVPSQNNRNRNKSGMSSRAQRRADKKAGIITYLIDTNVLLDYWYAIYWLKEHTVCIPGQVLRELDKYKADRKKPELAVNARRALRAIDRVVGSNPAATKEGVPIELPDDFKDGRENGGNMILYAESTPDPAKFKVDLDRDHPDDKIILAGLELRRRNHQVVLLSNDVACRIKAISVGLDAEEFFSEIQSEPNEEDVVTGFHQVGEDFWDQIGSDGFNILHGEDHDIYEFNHQMFSIIHPNQFVQVPVAGAPEQITTYRVLSKESPQKAKAKVIKADVERKVGGIVPRNIEQAMAMDLLLDYDVPAVSLGGPAGSGKTFLALAAASHLIMEQRRYKQLVVTRSATNSDEDIGFLPGTEEEKMSPWLGGIEDNLLALFGDLDGDPNRTDTGLEFAKKYMNMQIRSLNFIKGRSIEDSIIIVDETQDLNRSKLKKIATRVGSNSKIIFLGNVAQIDNTFVTELTCGTSIFIREFIDSPLVGHLTLQEGVRSSFATLAEDRL